MQINQKLYFKVHNALRTYMVHILNEKHALQSRGRPLISNAEVVRAEIKTIREITIHQVKN